MMADPTPTPSFRKVQNALVQLWEDIDGLNLFVDRADSEPLDESERPGAVIRIVNVVLGPGPDGLWMTMHRATIQVDCQSGNAAGETIDYRNQVTIAEMVARLHADRSLGGLLQSLEEQAMSGSEADGADVGTAIFELEAVWFTPRGDFYTIVGQAGATF